MILIIDKRLTTHYVAMFFVPFQENIIFCFRPATTNHSQTQQPHYMSQMQHRCICCAITLTAAILHNTRDRPDIMEHFVCVLSDMPCKFCQSNAITGARRLLELQDVVVLCIKYMIFFGHNTKMKWNKEFRTWSWQFCPDTKTASFLQVVRATPTFEF